MDRNRPESDCSNPHAGRGEQGDSRKGNAHEERNGQI